MKGPWLSFSDFAREISAAIALFAAFFFFGGLFLVLFFGAPP